MNKLVKNFVLALASTATLFSAVGCNAKSQKVELVETYMSTGTIKYITKRDTMDYYVMQNYTIDLYSDNTYQCDVALLEFFWKKSNEAQVVNKMNVFVASQVSRTGTYSKTVNEVEGTFSLSLEAADRVIYYTNAGGGHYPLVPSNDEGQVYFDSAKEGDKERFETEWFGKWDEFYNLVGAKVTLTGNEVTHILDKEQNIFDYKTPMFYTLSFDPEDIF